MIDFWNRSEPELLTTYLSMKGQNSSALCQAQLYLCQMLISKLEDTHVRESIVVYQ